MHLITGFAGENHVTSANDGVRNAMLFGKRCIFEVQNNMNAVKLNNNTVRIYDGYGVIDGRMFEIAKGDFEDVTIDNGQQNKSRIDLIVARYEKNDVDGTESISLAVVKGEATTGTPTEPTITEGNILNGDLIAEMPLYAVRINGIEIYGITRRASIFEYSIGEKIETLQSEIDAIGQSLSSGIKRKYISSTQAVNIASGTALYTLSLDDIFRFIIPTSANIINVAPVIKDCSERISINYSYYYKNSSTSLKYMMLGLSNSASSQLTLTLSGFLVDYI